MSDAELRALERAAVAGDDDARLRWAEALARGGNPQGAVAALAPFFEREGVAAAAGRLRATVLYLEAGEVETALTLAARTLPDGAWHGALRARIESEVTSTYGTRAARALGNLAPLEDLARIFAATRTQDVAPGVRALLAFALRDRDRALAARLAREGLDPDVAGILTSQGELLM